MWPDFNPRRHGRGLFYLQQTQTFELRSSLAASYQCNSRLAGASSLVPRRKYKCTLARPYSSSHSIQFGMTRGFGYLSHPSHFGTPKSKIENLPYLVLVLGLCVLTGPQVKPDSPWTGSDVFKTALFTIFNDISVGIEATLCASHTKSLQPECFHAVSVLRKGLIACRAIYLVIPTASSTQINPYSV